MNFENADWSGVWLPDGSITTRCQLALTGCHPDMSPCCPVSLTPANTHAHTQHAAHNSHTLSIPLRPSLTRHSSMPRRPIRRRLMRRSVTHLRMHDKVLLDFPVATVCSLLSLLNTHQRTHTHTCSHPQHTLIGERGCMSKAITSAESEVSEKGLADRVHSQVLKG